ncbi:MAG: hypothetical protein NTV00_00730 [Methylococcales bacterium]|nr:hypothetical protein [Methylococcales bacterium]
MMKIFLRVTLTVLSFSMTNAFAGNNCANGLNCFSNGSITNADDVNANFKTLSDKIGGSSPGSNGASGAQGPKGDTGATGSQGAPGAQGAKGDTGATGSQGAAGAQGTPGTQGAKGDTGATGSQGAPGAQGSKGDTGSINTSDLNNLQGQINSLNNILNSLKTTGIINGGFQVGDSTCSKVGDVVNPATGATSCPPNFTAVTVGRILHPETKCGAVQFVCKGFPN